MRAEARVSVPKSVYSRATLAGAALALGCRARVRLADDAEDQSSLTGAYP